MNNDALISRLKSIFPRLKMRNDGYFLDENDYVASAEVSWEEMVEELEKNGLMIIATKGNVKDLGSTVSMAKTSKAEPIMVDMKNYRANKLLKAVLKKHRKDKGEE
jgi:ketopantoate reductase